MKNPDIPILDNHMHIDPLGGRGIEAAKDFLRAGGTHVCLVTKPSWSWGIVPHGKADYRTVYDKTISIADEMRKIGLTVFVVLGVHPAEITFFKREAHENACIMMEGIDAAAEYVLDGKAIALKSGRPHYPVDEAIFDLSNQVLSHALTQGADCACSVQIHAESGPCADVVPMAKKVGMDPTKVVKHFAVPTSPLTLSLLARSVDIAACVHEGRFVMMESDYIDENTRPGSVIGPKSVPRFSKRLYDEGVLSEKDLYSIHKVTPEKIYGIEIEL
ncbi:MAG: TatD family hydrolase [Methanomicrobiales archaeon]|jgi:TatD-related deoxyribonuclease|nr:TatD family hydrolase [Methanomicrobiales archaeon]